MSVSRIEKPGIYDGLPAEVYHGNCTPEPALSSSGAKVLASKDPAAARRFWLHSPLNPDHVREQRRTFDIGTAAHLLALEPSAFAERVTIVNADDYKTTAARGDRDAAYAVGKTPLLPKELDTVQGIRRSIQADPIARHAFTGGIAERSYFWIDPEYGVWRKARLDYAPGDDAILRYIPDLKTAVSANPFEFQKRAGDLGYYQSAAWYMDAVEHFHGTRPADFYWIVAEKDAPYLVSVCRADPEALEWARLLNRRALDMFRLCLSRGDYSDPANWPAYGDRAHIIGLPAWTVKDLESRRDAGDFAANTPVQGPAFRDQQHAAGFAAQAPAAAK